MSEGGWVEAAHYAPAPPSVAAGPLPTPDRWNPPVMDRSELAQVRGEETPPPRAPHGGAVGASSAWDDEAVARLAAAVSQEVVSLLPPAQPPRSPELDRVVREVASSLAWLRAGQQGAGGAVPTWLLQAAGDPTSYDGPDSRREFVGWNVMPSTRTLLKQTQVRLGLRTLTGTLDYLVRLGVAASSGLPARR